MDSLKYIVVDNGGLAGPCLVVFPATMTHRDFLPMGTIRSAGFVGRNESTRSGFYTYGESISLGLKSVPDDQVLLDISWRAER